MLDVIPLLNAPAPWEAHGAAAPLPPDYAALLALWPGAPADFFRTSGPATEAMRAAKFQVPGLVFGDAAEQMDLAPATLQALQEAVTALSGEVTPRRLVLSGPIRWDGSLLIDNVSGVTLDFSAARIEVAQMTAPLIRVARSHRVALRGLRVGQRNAAVLDIASSSDVGLIDSACAGAAEAAVVVSGGAARVLIDRCAFLRNTGPALRLQGEVTDVIIARSSFEGPSLQAFIEASAALSARGFATQVSDPAEPGARDALTLMHPTGLRVLENRFGASDTPAILARGCLGLWVERNDFAGSASGILVAEGPGLGLMLADNRIQAPGGSGAALVSLADLGLACIFRNTFEPAGQVALACTGAMGGLLVAGNTLMAAPGHDAPASAAIHLAPDTGAAFLSCTLMLNTLRGPYPSGIVITDALPRLFLFDNHLFGMADWSLESRVPQPMATSMNNWSPVKSLNLPLSEELIDVARMVRRET
jgi:hypothetical protein